MALQEFGTVLLPPFLTACSFFVDLTGLGRETVVRHTVWRDQPSEDASFCQSSLHGAPDGGAGH